MCVFFLLFFLLFLIFLLSCVFNVSEVIDIVYQDHVASCLEERERVISAGGQVRWLVDTWRVGPAALQVSLFNFMKTDMLKCMETGCCLSS